MKDPVDVIRNMAAYLAPGSVDRVIAALAGMQHGVVAYRQLVALDVSRDEIQYRADCGRLHRIHRGVFAVGHATLTQKARWMAAVLAMGPGAALSHRSAAALWELRRQWRGKIEVTVPKKRRARKGIQPHVAQLPEDEITTHEGIPVTTPARTALDLAPTLEPQQLERLINQIAYRRLIDHTPLAEILRRYPRRAGTPAIKAALAKKYLPTDTDMEADYLAFCDEFDIPRPDATQVITRRNGRTTRADAVYAKHRKIVELDGDSHKTEAAFNDDRERDRRNLVAGWPTIRVTPRHLYVDRDELAADLHVLLGAETTRGATKAPLATA